MKDDCDGWLSKARPPKTLLKPSVAARQKGPLSRSTPPRRMVIKKATSNQAISYLTQNSPPPPQLMTARKQSTVMDYFGVKEVKCKSGIKEIAALRKERAPLTCTFRIQKLNCEQVLETTALENKVYEDRDFSHSLYQNVVNNSSLFAESCNAVEGKDLTSYGNSHTLHVHPEKRLDSVIKDSENCCTKSGCSCNKENCLQDCEMVCPSHLFVKRTTTTCYKEELVEEVSNSEIFYEKNGCRTTNVPDQFLTFSEGLRFLSSEDKIKCDNSEGFCSGQTHSLFKKNRVPYRNNSVVHSNCEDLCKDRRDRLVTEISNKHGKLPSYQKLQHKEAGEMGIQYSYCAGLALNDMQADVQGVLPIQELKELHNSFSSHTNSCSEQGLRGLDNIDLPLSNSSNDEAVIPRDFEDMKVLKLQQGAGPDRNCHHFTLKGSVADSIVYNSNDTDMHTCLTMKLNTPHFSEETFTATSVSLNAASMDTPLFTEASFNVASVNFKSSEAFQKLHFIEGVFNTSGVNRSIEVSMNTPNFTEESFTVSNAHDDDDSDLNASTCRQWSVLRSHQFQVKKQEYLSDIGTITFSENIE